MDAAFNEFFLVINLGYLYCARLYHYWVTSHRLCSTVQYLGFSHVTQGQQYQLF